MKQFDLIIIGGGAAGLMACASAITRGKNVLLLEKNNKLGVKILMSGGSRCNITHACDRRGIASAFGKQGRFLHSPLSSLSPEEVVGLIESTGVATKTEPGGKIFPVSDRAIDVRDALVKLATDGAASGRATIMKSTACQEISKVGQQFVVHCDGDSFTAAAVLITTGGQSYPGCGTTGDGYVWAKSFGHRIVPPVAALTPITNRNHWTNDLKGITFEDVGVEIVGGSDGKANGSLENSRGGFLFTHFGFSGPSVLDASRAVSRAHGSEDLKMLCDFSPQLNQEQLREHFREQLATKPKQTIGNLLADRWPKRFTELFLQQLQIPLDVRAAEFGKERLKRLTQHTKRSEIPIEGVYGFKKAEVTAGGVCLTTVDSRSMQSKLCPGLYFAGEVLDLDGPIGGYNFQSAFSTGWLAGQNC